IVRERGLYANWLWWYEGTGVIFLVFFYAKLWRRAGIITDAELIELRYSGRPAALLRGFSALYQGVLRNAVVMGWVMLAMVKFSQALLGWDPAFTLGVCVIVALVYTAASGLWGVVATDLLQFVVGLIGSLILAGLVVSAVGGPSGLVDGIRALPSSGPATLDLVPEVSHLGPLEFASFVCLILFLWVRSGQGDGYVAQRLFAAGDERQSMLSALWFAFAGIVLMTWPWVVVGLGSLLVLPASTAGPALAADPELAYPMMIGELMPTGLRGLVVAAFLAAFMSTMDTHLCWGASYLVNDVYRRFIRRGADEEHYVRASRIAVALLAVLAAGAAWQMESIQGAWIYVIELTAGVAVVWLLRWYWWRVNAWAEIAAMAGSVVLANGGVLVGLAARLGLAPGGLVEATSVVYGPEYDFIRATGIVLVCTILWVSVALLTPPDDRATLEAFYRKVRPGGWWGPVARSVRDVKVDGSAGARWLGFFLGTVFLYTSLLGVGYGVTGRPGAGAALAALSGLAAWLTLRVARREARIFVTTEEEG
ncbi:MAG: sodium:solute symporter family protein, partial [Gemmatimonadota bacterium]|nr:sodium:solute symporter family protein [Gemmatimonadota bacterium]